MDNRNRGCGHAVIGCGFWLEKNPDTVHSCHIAWIATDSIVEGYPECAAELASKSSLPSNSWPEMAANARMWLSYGSQQVWVADPPTATITIFRLNTAPVTLGEDDVLNGGELLPGFSTPVWRLFRRQR